MDLDAIMRKENIPLFALAGVLLLTVILLDRENKSFAGLSMDQVLSYVTEVDYGTYIETWMENAVNDLQAL